MTTIRNIASSLLFFAILIVGILFITGLLLTVKDGYTYVMRLYNDASSGDKLSALTAVGCVLIGVLLTSSIQKIRALLSKNR